jgi:hypothetical protein
VYRQVASHGLRDCVTARVFSVRRRWNDGVHWLGPDTKALTAQFDGCLHLPKRSSSDQSSQLLVSLVAGARAQVVADAEATREPNAKSHEPCLAS